MYVHTVLHVHYLHWHMHTVVRTSSNTNILTFILTFFFTFRSTWLQAKQVYAAKPTSSVTMLIAPKASYRLFFLKNEICKYINSMSAALITGHRNQNKRKNFILFYSCLLQTRRRKEVFWCWKLDLKEIEFTFAGSGTDSFTTRFCAECIYFNIEYISLSSND